MCPKPTISSVSAVARVEYGISAKPVMFPAFSSGGGSSKLAMYENGGYAISLKLR